jgi:isopenicillin N synthase-like dioxygenase
VRATLPVHPVDLEPFRLGGVTERLEVARAIDAACRDSGFLLITGHGVPQPTCDAVLDEFGAFFDLPLEAKERCAVADPRANRGYTRLGKEALGYSRGATTPPDLFEAFNVGREDTTGAYFDTHRDFYAPNLWPPAPVGLYAAWQAYEGAVERVARWLLEAMALALELPPGWFVEQCRNAIVTTRAINYQRAADAPKPEPSQMRMGAHSDYGVVTILLADDVGGLQVLRDDVWHDITTPRGAFVCNIGDMLERWTNDRWRSTLHRVVPPPAFADGPVRRRSIARFLDCPPDLIVECIPTCCSPEAPARYQPVVAGEWLTEKVLGGREQRRPDLPDLEIPPTP